MKDGLPTPTIRARHCNSNSPSKMRASSQQLGPQPKPIGASSATGRNVPVPKTHIDTVQRKTPRSRLPSSLISDGTAQIITLWRNGHGMDEDYSSPPAQIPACAANAPGSSLGFWRRSGDKAVGVES